MYNLYWFLVWHRLHIRILSFTTIFSIYFSISFMFMIHYLMIRAESVGRRIRLWGGEAIILLPTLFRVMIISANHSIIYSQYDIYLHCSLSSLGCTSGLIPKNLIPSPRVYARRQGYYYSDYADVDEDADIGVLNMPYQVHILFALWASTHRMLRSSSALHTTRCISCRVGLSIPALSIRKPRRPTPSPFPYRTR